MESTKQSPSEPQPPAKLTIEYDGKHFNSRIDGEIPVIPLLGVLVLQAIQLAAGQIARDEQQKTLAQAVSAARGGKLFMPDGTPYSP